MKNRFIILFLTGLVFLSMLVYYKRSSQNNLYVSQSGSDQNDGKNKPYKSIQYSIDHATPGTTIKIQPGIYRESITISKSVKADSPIRIVGDSSEKGNVVIVGSEPSSSMKWGKCDELSCRDIPQTAIQNVYYTTLDWNEIPYLLFEKTSDGQEQELYLARIPNFQVNGDGKYHQDWWTASDSSNNQFVLKDKENLTDTTNLTGSTAYIMDGADRCGNFLYVRNIDKYQNSELVFNYPVGFSIFGLQENGIGPYSKYYIEGNIKLLDSPGEWYYDKSSKKLYLWPVEENNPADLEIEIAKRPFGIDLSNAANIEIDGITVKYINNPPYQIDNSGAIILKPNPGNVAQGITIKNSKIEYAGNGIVISANDTYSKIENINLDNIKISNILRDSISVTAASNTGSNIQNLNISNSEFYENSYYFNSGGINIARVSNLVFKNNFIHDNATTGLHIASFEKNPFISENITIEKNRIERVCQNISGCGGLKFYGGRFSNTVARDNIIMNNNGWSYCQEKKNRKGFAHGVFISNASGVTLERNISLRNTGAAFHAYPRQIETSNNKLLNNLAGYSDIGIDLASAARTRDLDPIIHQTRHNNSIIKNNIFLENETGLQISAENPEKLQVDYNAFIDNGRDVNSIINSSGWNQHSIRTSKTVFKNADKLDFNLPFSSILRGKGEPFINNPFIDFQFDFLGLSNDIGPCKFQWIGESCPDFNKFLINRI